MAERTGISWTNHTFNPWLGCEKISPGCKHCYAETLIKNRMGLDIWGPSGKRKVTSASYWNQPFKWQRAAEKAGKKAKVFCASLADVFEENEVADATRPRLWGLIRNTPNLIWQILTKRPDRIRSHLPDDWDHRIMGGYANVWFGTSIENNDYVFRAEELKRVPCRLCFVSYEPALGPLDKLSLSGIDWMIFGGESGPGFRRCDLEWAREMRDRCRLSHTAFFFKQDSALRPGTNAELDGEQLYEFPEYNYDITMRVGAT